jgi:hypothetical protein
MLPVLGVIVMLAGCGAYSGPEFLAHTPGPAVVVADGLVRTDAFEAAHPQGWRVITGPAQFPLSIIMAGEGCQLIQLGVGDFVPEIPVECAGQDMETVRRDTDIALAGGPLSLVGSSPRAGADAFAAIFGMVADSVRPTAP